MFFLNSTIFCTYKFTLNMPFGNLGLSFMSYIVKRLVCQPVDFTQLFIYTLYSLGGKCGELCLCSFLGFVGNVNKRGSV